MAHFKRRRPKHVRAGCLMCKPYKHDRGSNGAKRPPVGQRRRDEADAQAMRGDERDG